MAVKVLRTVKFRQTLDWKTLFRILRQTVRRTEMAKRHELLYKCATLFLSENKEHKSKSYEIKRREKYLDVKRRRVTGGRRGNYTLCTLILIISH